MRSESETVGAETTLTRPRAPAHLHPDDGIDEEQHGDQKADVGQGLEGKQRYDLEFKGRQLPGSAACSRRQYKESCPKADLSRLFGAVSPGAVLFRGAILCRCPHLLTEMEAAGHREAHN